MTRFYLFRGFVFGSNIKLSFFFNGHMLYTFYWIPELFCHFTAGVLLIFGVVFAVNKVQVLQVVKRYFEEAFADVQMSFTIMLHQFYLGLLQQRSLLNLRELVTVDVLSIGDECLQLRDEGLRLCLIQSNKDGCKNTDDCLAVHYFST